MMNPHGSHLDTGACSVTGTDAGGSLETASATATGLRTLTGINNADGTVSLYAATATSSLTDQGADPNSVLATNDMLSAATLPVGEAYTAPEVPQLATVYRVVAETPFAAEPATPTRARRPSIRASIARTGLPLMLSS